MTFRPTRLLPSSGECASGPERSSAAKLVAKPIAEITTLPSAAAARVRRYTLTASGTPSLLRMGDAHLPKKGRAGSVVCGRWIRRCLRSVGDALCVPPEVTPPSRSRYQVANHHAPSPCNRRVTATPARSQHGDVISRLPFIWRLQVAPETATVGAERDIVMMVVV